MASNQRYQTILTLNQTSSSKCAVHYFKCLMIPLQQFICNQGLEHKQHDIYYLQHLQTVQLIIFIRQFCKQILMNHLWLVRSNIIISIIHETAPLVQPVWKSGSSHSICLLKHDLVTLHFLHFSLPLQRSTDSTLSMRFFSNWPWSCRTWYFQFSSKLSNCQATARLYYLWIILTAGPVNRF